MRHYEFGLLHCVGVSFVFAVGFAAVAACIVETGGFLVGTAAKRLRNDAVRPDHRAGNGR